MDSLDLETENSLEPEPSRVNSVMQEQLPLASPNDQSEQEFQVVEETSPREEERVSLLAVLLNHELECRDYLEGMKMFIEKDLETTVPLVSHVMASSCKKRSITKYWQIFRTMQKLISSEEWIEKLVQEREAIRNGEEENEENLNERFLKVKEFFQGDAFQVYFQNLEIALIAPLFSEELESETDIVESLSSDDELQWRYTLGEFPARPAESSEFHCVDVKPSTTRSQSWAGPATGKKGKSKFLAKSSLVVEEDKTGLMVIGRGAVLQSPDAVAAEKKNQEAAPLDFENSLVAGFESLDLANLPAPPSSERD